MRCSRSRCTSSIDFAICARCSRRHVGFHVRLDVLGRNAAPETARDARDIRNAVELAEAAENLGVVLLQERPRHLGMILAYDCDDDRARTKRTAAAAKATLAGFCCASAASLAPNAAWKYVCISIGLCDSHAGAEQLPVRRRVGITADDSNDDVLERRLQRARILDEGRVAALRFGDRFFIADDREIADAFPCEYWSLQHPSSERPNRRGRPSAA